MAIKKLKYAALCIGVNNYDHNRHLTCAVNDAEAVAEAFTDLGYDVIKLIDEEATYYNYTSAYERLMSEDYLKHYDAILLYFAGHGFVANRSDCLALKDCAHMRVGDGLPAKARSINIQDFIDAFHNRNAPVVVLILDACRIDLSDYADMEERGTDILTSEDLGKCVHVPTQTFIAYSTSFNSGAKDGGGDNGHSKYTAALLDVIKDQKPIESIFKEVRSKVHQKDSDQLPWEYTCLTSDFYLNYGQLDPYYYAEYSRVVFICDGYISSDENVSEILKEIGKKHAYNIAVGTDILIKNKGKISDDDLFFLGRKLYAMSVESSEVSSRFLKVQLLRQFGENINHLLRGIYYEIYFDEKDNTRTQLLGNAEMLTTIDRLQMFLKNTDAAKFIKKYILSKGSKPLFELWDITSMVDVEVEAEEMYCTNSKDISIYGIKTAIVNDEPILLKLRGEDQGIVDRMQLRQLISESLSVPLQRLRIKGLEQDTSSERLYMLYYIDNIEQQLQETINYNLPDDISILSSNSYVDELGEVVITDVIDDGNDVYIEGSCQLDVHNEFDGEDMPNCSFPCEFKVKLYYNEDTDEYEIDGADAQFNVDTETYYE